MSKYISVFFLSVFVSFILFFIFGSIFLNDGNPAEEAVYTVGAIIIFLLSFLIAQIYYVINLIKKKM
ncbi:hypothetical protein [Oceanobacillus chungangensis]|uniref:Uncharacterized protein n=1 Tax=Oceanobacillus chungangensis TaxID=1229152 RepID=A0A3D8PNI0_9BACI|nr:hypothetical protein [Oceanobacillus chungangensis]RDW17067.1 hypothetical protein CWR45_13095 [Oceanobacillus chungangensis]